MNIVNIKLLFILWLLFIVSACGGKSSDLADKNTDDLTKLSYQTMSTVHNEKSVATLGSDIAKVYKKESKLIFNPSGNKEIVISEQINSERYWLATSGHYVHIIWWEKFANMVKGDENQKIAGKVLYVRSSQDSGKTFGGRQVITHAGGVLPKIRIVADEKGNINLAYLDERFGGFNIFTNSSQDGGKTWKENDLKLDHDAAEAMNQKNHTAVSPNIAQSNNIIVSSWQQLDIEDGKQVLKMYSRVSDDYGKTWGKEALVYHTDKTLSFSMQMYGDNNQVYLIAGMQSDGILLFTKKANEAWKKVDGILPNSNKGKGGSYYKMVSDDKYFYLTYIFVEKIEGSKLFWHTEVARLDIAENKWMPGSYRLDSRGMGVQSKGGYQDIVKLNDGTIVVVWEDFRRILPMIAMNYSTDKGKTWLNVPLFVSRQDIVNNSERPFIRKIGNNFTVFYNNNLYPEQIQPKYSTVATSLISPQSPEFNKKALLLKSLPSSDIMKKRLAERFKSLRDARINKKWKQAWPLQDPLYRNLYKKKTWLKTRDRLIYKKLDLDSIKLDIPYGYALGKMVYDLDADFIDAKSNDPRFTDQKKEFVFKWGWFVDNWYLITETGTEPYLP